MTMTKPAFSRRQVDDERLCQQLRDASVRTRHKWTADMLQQAASRIAALSGASHPDTARLDWLAEEVECNRAPQQGITLWSDDEVPDGADAMFALSDYSHNTRGATLREAIDAAMSKEPR